MNFRLSVTALALALAVAAPLAAQTLTDAERRDVREYVAPYLKKPVRLDLSRAPVDGDAKAEITLIEFSDFQCPFCKESQQLLKALRERYGKRLRVAFLHYPLQMHPEARPAARAAWAAGRQGKFWQYHDGLFERQNELGDAFYVRLAGDLGLDIERFNRDRASAEAEQALLADIRQGEKVPVEGTPTFVVNGVPTPNVPLPLFEEVIRVVTARGK
jgi:protein-disulfide isomerase